MPNMFALLCLLAGFWCGASEAADNFSTFPHPVWDSGIYVTGIIYPAWIDDETLLFAGMVRKPRNDEETRTWWPSLYLWRLGENPKPYGIDPVEAAKAYCAEGGWIRYQLPETRDPDTGKKIYNRMEGPVGQEVHQAIEAAPSDGSNPFLLIPSNDAYRTETDKCGLRADLRMKERVWVTDADKKFYIDFGAKSEFNAQRNIHLTLMRSDGSDPVELPINYPKDTWPRCTHYHRFMGAFIVWNCLNLGSDGPLMEAWRSSGCWPAWYVWPPDGRTEKFCLPYSEWSPSGLEEWVPSKAGMFFTVTNFLKARSLKDPWLSGLYRLENGKANRVLAGIVQSATVSPSGCKVAFSYAPYTLAERIGTPGTRSLVVADLCAHR